MDSFLLTYDGFDPAAEGLREALTSTGNGHLCTRGAAEWEDADGMHYPGTYVHGGYNRETTILGGQPQLNEGLVNLPNWLVLQLRIEGEDAIRLADVELLSYRHELDIRYAAVVHHLRFRDRSGRETTLLGEIFGRLGYAYSADTVRRNVAYYDRRTSHGSMLSFVTHAGVLAAIDPDSSWEQFLVALHSDAGDIQGGTTKEGIHLGVMSGTLNLVQRYYACIFVRDGVLYFEPRLPARLDALSFPMRFREASIQGTLTGDRLTLAVHPRGREPPGPGRSLRRRP